jgi:glycosyltransferase involved in cell wall biosynthesis
LKILFLTHSFPRFAGDAPGSFLLRLARALAAENVVVHVIAPSAPGLPGSEEIEGIQVQRFRYAPSGHETLAYTGNMAHDVASSWSARLALIGYLGADLAKAVAARKRQKPDVIHAHWWFPSGLVGHGLKLTSGTPLVTTLHGTDVRMAKSIGTSRPFMRAVLGNSDAVTTVSSWLAAEVEALAPGSRPDVAPMPVATERFLPGGNREPARFLFAGRLNQQKGLGHLLKALASMQRLAMLDVVGEGKDAASLKQHASQLGVSDRIVWHGQLDQESLLRHYRSATAVVVPSVDEGLGLVAAEALLCEAPVIAFRSGGLTDVIQHGTTGVLVTPGDTAELARALDAVLASPEHAANLGRAGRSFALSAFSPEAAARRYADIYRDVIESRAA